MYTPTDANSQGTAMSWSSEGRQIFYSILILISIKTETSLSSTLVKNQLIPLGSKLKRKLPDKLTVIPPPPEKDSEEIITYFCGPLRPCSPSRYPLISLSSWLLFAISSFQLLQIALNSSQYSPASWSYPSSSCRFTILYYQFTFPLPYNITLWV